MLHLSGMLENKVKGNDTLKLLDSWKFCSCDLCKQCDNIIALEHFCQSSDDMSWIVNPSNVWRDSSSSERVEVYQHNLWQHTSENCWASESIYPSYIVASPFCQCYHLLFWKKVSKQNSEHYYHFTFTLTTTVILKRAWNDDFSGTQTNRIEWVQQVVWSLKCDWFVKNFYVISAQYCGHYFFNRRL